jgi:hypothetical protein
MLSSTIFYAAVVVAFASKIASAASTAIEILVKRNEAGVDNQHKMCPAHKPDLQLTQCVDSAVLKSLAQPSTESRA